MLGKIEGRRKRGQQRMRWLDGITDLMDMSLSRHHGVKKSWTQLRDCTTPTIEERVRKQILTVVIREKNIPGIYFSDECPNRPLVLRE